MILLNLLVILNLRSGKQNKSKNKYKYLQVVCMEFYNHCMIAFNISDSGGHVFYEQKMTLS